MFLAFQTGSKVSVCYTSCANSEWSVSFIYSLESFKPKPDLIYLYSLYILKELEKKGDKLDDENENEKQEKKPEDEEEAEEEEYDDELEEVK